MEFLGGGKSTGLSPAEDRPLYRALAAGDLPAAWLLARPMLERDKMEQLPWWTAYNCGLCLYRLGEDEKALAALKRAEQVLGTPPEVERQERRRFLKALSMAGDEGALLPLDPDGGRKLERYALLRVRWLMVLCLTRLERRQEAAPLIRFLNQYRMEE